MESTIILKSDALNALVAAHRLMEEMTSRSQPSVESIQFRRGFSAALSTIATVFGLELEIGVASLSPHEHWRISDERELSILESEAEALDWPRIPSASSGVSCAGQR